MKDLARETMPSALLDTETGASPFGTFQDFLVLLSHWICIITVGWFGLYGSTDFWSSFGREQLHSVVGSVHTLRDTVLSLPATVRTPVGMGGKSVRLTQIEGAS